MQPTRTDSLIVALAELFENRGGESYADEEVTQLQHALQTATLALEEKADDRLIVAAFLHDLGHILEPHQLPTSCEEDLDDHHESVARQFLGNYFDATVLDPITLHVAAKRYLCTIEQDYADQLSPTSLKSYYDQGGPMSPAEIENFQSEPHFEAALRLRRWDDQAKSKDAQTPTIDFFLKKIESLSKT